MSRSDYCDDFDIDQWALIRWRGAVNSALNGKRGQAFLREIVAALDALPEKKLIAGELEAHGAYCTLGAVGKKRGMDLSPIDPEDAEGVSEKFGIASAMAREIVYMNDEQYFASPEERWYSMRQWAIRHIKEEKST